MCTARAAYSSPIYAYLIPFTDRVKVYRPVAQDKTKKWKSNCIKTDIFGLENLPNKGKILIITKSLKDVMVLRTFGFNAISLQAESIKIDDDIRPILRPILKRFENTILWYDNDTAGIKGSVAASYELKCPYTYIPGKYKQKDISDFVRDFGRRKTWKLIKKLIKDALTRHSTIPF